MQAYHYSPQFIEARTSALRRATRHTRAWFHIGIRVPAPEPKPTTSTPATVVTSP